MKFEMYKKICADNKIENPYLDKYAFYKAYPPIIIKEEVTVRVKNKRPKEASLKTYNEVQK